MPFRGTSVGRCAGAWVLACVMLLAPTLSAGHIHHDEPTTHPHGFASFDHHHHDHAPPEQEQDSGLDPDPGPDHEQGTLDCSTCALGDRVLAGLLPNTLSAVAPVVFGRIQYDLGPFGPWPARTRPPYEGRAPPSPRH